jgi:hypothetical protein
MIGKTTREERLRKLRGGRAEPAPDAPVAPGPKSKKPTGWDAHTIKAVRDAEPIGLAELTESVRDATAWMHWAPTTDEAVEASVRRLVTHGCLEWTADGYTHCWPRWAKLMGLK